MDERERFLDGIQVMMSMSDSPDLGALRMGTQHFTEAMKEIVRHLLSRGAALAYGGDLRKQGLTATLFDLARTYNATDPEGGKAKIRSYLASTFWEELGEASDVARNLRRKYDGAADVWCLPPPESAGGDRSGTDEDRNSRRTAAALTDMRRRIIEDSNAVVFLGGKVTGYAGQYPGVLEEVVLSLDRSRPVYLLGGFGGCAADAARALLGNSPVDPETRRLDRDYRPDYHQAIGAIREYEGRMPANGLDRDDNTALALSSDIRVIVPLLLRGLRAIAERR